MYFVSSILYLFKKTIPLGENQAAISKIIDLSLKLSKITLSNNFVLASINVEKLSAEIFLQYSSFQNIESNQSHLDCKSSFVRPETLYK